MDEIVRQYRQPSVSIIVPVYNTEDYLERCLNSLKLQTINNIEVIVIDDGSSDGSGLICDRFAEEDNRFIVYHKNKNEGLSSARNTGISFAKAEYIMFVDSDDWVDSDFCKYPITVAKEKKADLVVFQYYLHKGNKKIIKRDDFPEEGIISKQKLMTEYWPYVDVVAWNKLYKRELFNNIQYPVGHLCEDAAVTYNIVYKAETVFAMNKCLYHYSCLRPGSISSIQSDQFINDAYYYGHQRIEALRQWGYSTNEEELKLALTYLIICGRGAEYSLQSQFVIQNSICIPNNITFKQKIMLYTYKISPFLFDLISVGMGKRKRNL